MTTTRRATFTTTMRMIHGVHGHTANGGTNTTPAGSTGLAQRTKTMFTVTHFTNNRTTLDVHLAHLTGAQAESGIVTLAGHQLRRSAGTARNLRTLAPFHFDAVNRSTDRHATQGQAVTGLDGRFRTRHDLSAGGNALGCNDITTLTIGVQHQCDICTAIRIILQTLDTTGDTILVALEINNPIVLLVTTAFMTSGDTTLILTTSTTNLRPGDVGFAFTIAILPTPKPYSPPMKSISWPALTRT